MRLRPWRRNVGEAQRPVKLAQKTGARASELPDNERRRLLAALKGENSGRDRFRPAPVGRRVAAVRVAELAASVCGCRCSGPQEAARVERERQMLSAAAGGRYRVVGSDGRGTRGAVDDASAAGGRRSDDSGRRWSTTRLCRTLRTRGWPPRRARKLRELELRDWGSWSGDTSAPSEVDVAELAAMRDKAGRIGRGVGSCAGSRTRRLPRFGVGDLAAGYALMSARESEIRAAEAAVRGAEPSDGVGMLRRPVWVRP